MVQVTPHIERRVRYRGRTSTAWWSWQRGGLYGFSEPEQTDVMGTLLRVLQEARGCTVCASALPLGPRPLLGATTTSRVLIIGQAPGRAAHESGIPWHDRSGDRLRDWLGMSPETFYDAVTVALMPMGFCYPGKGTSGDLSPRAECAPLWHAPILRALKKVELTVYVGSYAFGRYMGSDYASLTDAVRGCETLLPGRIVLPHSSPRNNIWLKKNAWFAIEVVPRLRERILEIIG